MAEPQSHHDHSQAPLILASASPRRKQLLARIGIRPHAVYASNIDETAGPMEKPAQYVARMAREKAEAARDAHHNCWIISGDTVVAAGQRILPKAEDESTAHSCLKLLSGRRHKVLSAVALCKPEGEILQRTITSLVQFKPLSNQDIATYMATGEWHGKAGGYAIQGYAEAFVKRLDGSHSAVMGLPLYDIRNMLISAGYRMADARTGEPT